MLSFQVDLTNCDREPIHIPGNIQAHGCLLVVDKNCIINYHSENISAFFDLNEQNLLGKHVSVVENAINPNDPDFICHLINLGKNNKGFEQINPYHIRLENKLYYLVISTSDDNFLLEFEPGNSDLNVDIQKMVGRSVSEILADRNLQNMLNNTAKQVKQIINYDRVMLYRFADDGHGEVVSEAKNDNLESWLGLHYPATDIPKQARNLYKLNLTRLIADVNSVPSSIITSADNEQPLDLTYSQLRAVSPVHIQYLKNMKVESSFSITLMYKDELWGLIACHNYTPRFIDYKSRESSKLIGQILSSALEFRQDEENQAQREQYNSVVDQLAKLLLKNNSIEDALTTQDVTILDAVSATGAVLVYEKSIIKLGVTPNEVQLNSLLSWIRLNISETFYRTNFLSDIFPEAEAYKHIASGLMVFVLSRELDEYVLWFKPEQLETVKWAGNPEKPVEAGPDIHKLTPRVSFDVWSLTVIGRSTQWSSEEIKAAMRLREEITYAINQKAGAIRQLNERLKQAYEELDTFSFTISHDLKNPISAIKSYSQILQRDKQITHKSQLVIDRILDRADKMNMMITEVLDYSRIGRSEIQPVRVELEPIINEILKDLLVVYNDARINVSIGKTPAVHGDRVMITQIFSNLISNAIKYSLPSSSPRIKIEGKETETSIIYSVEDNGIGIDIKHLPRVFELFNRMDNAKEIEGSGVGLAIVKRIVERHKGKIWVDSEVGKGSAFYVAFNKQL